MEKIELNDGTHINYDTFVGLADNIICDYELTDNQIEAFYFFVKDEVKKHMNYFIDRGMERFCFDGIDVLFDEEIKKHLELSN
jgi:hypothetical protein